MNYKVFKDSGIQNVYYLPFVYPVTKSTEKKGFEEGFKILSIGKFVKRKDHILLVKAVEKLSVKYKIRLHIVGEKADPNYFKQIEDYIREKSLEEIISLGNHVPYHEINNLYRQFHLFVLPAFDEPAAYSPVEAMANGLPVICSSQNETKCYIEEGKNGFIFEAKNLDDLCTQIEKVISVPDEWQKMSDWAFEIAKRNHNPANFNDALLKLIE
jgi:glycosyltransferase involved in cell wall biosynthesis